MGMGSYFRPGPCDGRADAGVMLGDCRASRHGIAAGPRRSCYQITPFELQAHVVRFILNVIALICCFQFLEIPTPVLFLGSSLASGRNKRGTDA
jgi:hypothetical protein